MDNRVTIVVPVYKDWETLRLCIDSLKLYVDSINKVLLINDMGPEWQVLEDKIKNAIIGLENFVYVRNNENLGFVKTCNRAVFEIDKSGNDIFLLNSDTEVTEGFLEEMQTVLYAAEKHGMVCPRSNNATLLTVPVKNGVDKAVTAEQSYELYKQIKCLLPRQKVIPTGVGFAILIKRKLIDQYGLFDEIYSPGYNEENDFCMRINQYGFNVMMANWAYVFHYESKSFGEKKLKLDEAHSLILSERYPFYWDRVNLYFEKQIEAVDYFADLFADGLYKKKCILFSLYELPAAYNGTAQHGLLLLKNFYQLFKDKYDISVLINSAADEFFHISQAYPNVYLPEQLNKRYHIAYVPSQIIHIEHLFILNRSCLKYAFCMQDIISIRSSYLLVEDWEREDVFKKSIKYCDGIMPFSQFSLDDMKDYYKDEFLNRNIYTKVVYLAGVDEEISQNDENVKIPYSNYFIVLGNQYKHKNLEAIEPYLCKSNYNFIIIGSKEDGYIDNNIYGYKSGNLSSGFMDCLIKQCTAIVFPSVYEGFGLPILNAIKYKKKIIINNNPLNREQVACLEYYRENIYLFDVGSELEGYLRTIISNPDPLLIYNDHEQRSWEDVAIEIEAGMSDILCKSIDIRMLNARWDELKYLERVHRCYGTDMHVNLNEKLKSKLIRFLKMHAPCIYKILKSAFRKLGRG